MSQAVNLVSTFEHDVNISAAEKQKVLKMLQTVLTNVLTKDDEKFRQLRLSNPKIQSMTRHPTIQALLTSVAGFLPQGDDLLKVTTVPSTLNDSVLASIAGALQRVSVASSSSGSLATSTSKLTEKQKARLLADERAALEKEQDRQARKRTAAQIKADKHVRENDPNWKPSVNAAAAKAGTSISTFRDKFGE